MSSWCLLSSPAPPIKYSSVESGTWIKKCCGLHSKQRRLPIKFQKQASCSSKIMIGSILKCSKHGLYKLIFRIWNVMGSQCLPCHFLTYDAKRAPNEPEAASHALISGSASRWPQPENKVREQHSHDNNSVTDKMSRFLDRIYSFKWCLHDPTSPWQDPRYEKPK